MSNMHGPWPVPGIFNANFEQIFASWVEGHWKLIQA